MFIELLFDIQPSRPSSYALRVPHCRTYSRSLLRPQTTPSLTKQTACASWPEKHPSCLVFVVLRGAFVPPSDHGPSVAVTSSASCRERSSRRDREDLLPLPDDLDRRLPTGMMIVEHIRRISDHRTMTIERSSVVLRRCKDVEV